MSIRKIKQAQLIRVFKDLKDHPDDGCCFLLGAGASVASGIPSGGELARRWYAELKEIMDGQELDAWHQEIIGFDANRVDEFYPQIFERRFLDHPNTGYFQLQDSMEGAEPSIGYSFLAQVLTKTQHKFVITTNFDHMVEDAIRTYTAERPLVCGHESLAQYFNARSDRPAIIKVHRDLLLHPFNNTQNTDELDEAWKAALAPIFQHYHLVVIGYGGNDGSLMDYLKDIGQCKGIYWCCRNEAEINDKIRLTLKQERDCIVEIDGFDEFMLALNYAFDYPLLIDRDNLSESPVVKIALAKAERYKHQLEQFVEQKASPSNKVGEDNTVTTEALLKLFGLDEKPTKNWWEIQKNWWVIQLKINQEEDPERQRELYENGLRLLPDSAKLNGNYAFFLHEIRKDYDQAEIYYRKALELDANDANNNGNFANFLTDIRKDYDQAEIYYRKALELYLNDAGFNGNYAIFLYYAIFLTAIRKDYDQAELYYRKALELAPNHANFNGSYALFLNNIRKDYDQAEIYYRKALELDPNNVDFNGNYAIFLHEIRKDYDQAEIYFRKALELDPNHANNNGNYATFLYNTRKDYGQAEFYYRKALELAPNDVNCNGHYANFLYDIRKDYELAQNYYRKALELNPNHADFNGNYASFLHNTLKNYDQAEIYYRKALELDPNSANKNGNYVGLLLALGKQKQAAPYLEIAMQGERKDVLLECWFYRLAHYPEWREQAQQHIETLLQQGVRSPNWDLSANIERAIQDGYPDPEELRLIAARIREVPAD